MEEIVAEGAAGFGLGPVEAIARVDGGLSHDMWRVTTAHGDFAVKVMRAHAGSAGFRENIEAAFAIEQNAYRAGVPCPEPRTTSEGRALLRVRGALLRAHHWHDGAAPSPGDHLEDAGELLATIHAAGRENERALEDHPMSTRRWAALAALPGLPDAVSEQLHAAAPVLARLGAMTATRAPLRTAFVDSHGDLDPKNTLLSEGRLLAVDWDAAGPRSVAREAVTLALDWSDDVEGFQRVRAAYCDRTARALPSEAWIFGGWVEALSGWLVYNAEERARTDLGAREVAAACTRLLSLHASFDEYVRAAGTP